MTMEDTYFSQQTRQPLFPDVQWSKPEQRSLAGKLGLIGGNAHGFFALAQAYQAANQAGIGVSRPLMPVGLKKTLGPIMVESQFAPATKSGGFSVNALDDWLILADWADAILIAGDLGQNSETAILLERFLEKTNCPLTLAGDSIDLVLGFPLVVLEKEISLILSLSQLQKLLIAIRYPSAVKSTMSLYQLAELLHSVSASYPLTLTTWHEQQVLLALKGQVSATTIDKLPDAPAIGATLAVWRLQQPSKAYQAMTTALFSLAE